MRGREGELGGPLVGGAGAVGTYPLRVRVGFGVTITVCEEGVDGV